MALTKLDVLSGLENIKTCVAYERNGRSYYNLPDGAEDLSSFRPVYEDMLGWSENIGQVRDFDHLPVNAQFYVRRIECLTGVKVSVISVGPERDQMFDVKY